MFSGFKALMRLETSVKLIGSSENSNCSKSKASGEKGTGLSRFFGAVPPFAITSPNTSETKNRQREILT